jgi:hypothetical protein
VGPSRQEALQLGTGIPTPFYKDMSAAGAASSSRQPKQGDLSGRIGIDAGVVELHDFLNARVGGDITACDPAAFRPQEGVGKTEGKMPSVLEQVESLLDKEQVQVKLALPRGQVPSAIGWQ